VRRVAFQADPRTQASGRLKSDARQIVKPTIIRTVCMRGCVFGRHWHHRGRQHFVKLGVFVSQHDQAAASGAEPVDAEMNSSKVWQTIADGARPRIDALISAFRA
jgi:hypothetical protein